ncbi:hypothetical protein TS70_06590, partial [Spiroplasma sp. hyd1]|nr:hypothetical protein [Spiroplasma sp. hyd1]
VVVRWGGARDGSLAVVGAAPIGRKGLTVAVGAHAQRAPVDTHVAAVGHAPSRDYQIGHGARAPHEAVVLHDHVLQPLGGDAVLRADSHCPLIVVLRIAEQVVGNDHLARGPGAAVVAVGVAVQTARMQLERMADAVGGATAHGVVGHHPLVQPPDAHSVLVGITHVVAQQRDAWARAQDGAVVGQAAALDAVFHDEDLARVVELAGRDVAVRVTAGPVV